MIDSLGNVHEWKRQYLGEFSALAVPPEDRAAIEYHLRCEEYDDRVCSRRDDRTGETRPGNPREMALINQNALLVRREVQVAYPEVPPNVLVVAIRRWSLVRIERMKQTWELIRQDDLQQKREMVMGSV